MDFDFKLDIFSQLVNLDARPLQVLSERVKFSGEEIGIGSAAWWFCG
jgi:hypothetical protein